MNNVVLDSKRIEAIAPAVAGATTLTSAVLDMQGFDSVVFAVRVGTLTAGQTKGVMSVNAGNVANGSDMAALAGASITIQDGDTGKWEIMEVVKPANFRYVELVLTRNTQAIQLVAALAIFHFVEKKPASDDATTVAQTMLVVDPEYANASLTVTNSTYASTTTQIVNTVRTSS